MKKRQNMINLLMNVKENWRYRMKNKYRKSSIQRPTKGIIGSFRNTHIVRRLNMTEEKPFIIINIIIMIIGTIILSLMTIDNIKEIIEMNKTKSKIAIEDTTTTVDTIRLDNIIIYK